MENFVSYICLLMVVVLTNHVDISYAANCSAAATGCRDCGTVNGTNCTACEAGYFHDINTCTACSITNCQTCTSGTVCATCDNGYSLSNSTCSQDQVTTAAPSGAQQVIMSTWILLGLTLANVFISKN